MPTAAAEFFHLVGIHVRLAHEVRKCIGNRAQLALDRLIAPPLCVLEHRNEHDDDDRHGRRTRSQPGVREAAQYAEREPQQHTGDATDEEGPPADGVHGRRGDFVESAPFSLDLAP